MKVQSGEASYQLVLTADTMHRIRVAAALRKQTMRRFFEEAVTKLLAETPGLPPARPVGGAKPRKR